MLYFIFLYADITNTGHIPLSSLSYLSRSDICHFGINELVNTKSDHYSNLFVLYMNWIVLICGIFRNVYLPDKSKKDSNIKRSNMMFYLSLGLGSTVDVHVCARADMSALEIKS